MRSDLRLSETAERPEGEPGGSSSFSWPPGHPEALSHHSPSLLRAPLPSQASPLLGLLCPQRISSALRTQRPGMGHVSVQSFSLASELQTQGSSHLPAWSHGVSLGLKKWWQKQTTIPPIPPPTPTTLPPGLTHQVTEPSPGSPWFLPLSLPPPASTIPMASATSHNLPATLVLLSGGHSSLLTVSRPPPPSSHGPASHPLTAAREILLESQVMILSP